jgi:hypothetical protein
MPTLPASWDIEDALLARNIFGTDDPALVVDMIFEWLRTRFDSSPDHMLSFEMSVGAAAGARLKDGSNIFIKVWPGNQDVAVLDAQLRVQGALARNGFPAPGIILQPCRLGPGHAAAMEFDRSGVPVDARMPDVRSAMAKCLSRLICDAADLATIDNLPKRQLPSRHDVWPAPHNALFDFGGTAAGAEWIDDLARETLGKLSAAQGAVVVGHHDWSAKNMRMGEDEIAVVYDWDAVYLDRETAFVGSAAAHFPVTWELPVPETPTPEEMSAFLAAYQSARGDPFSKRELDEIAAYATYARAYKARCEHCLDQDGTRWNGSSRQALAELGAYTAASLQP